MSARYPIRTITPDEFDAFTAMPEHAFLPDWPPEARAVGRRVIEFDRSIAAFGRDLVGEVIARRRPVDDPLLAMLADPRRGWPRERADDGSAGPPRGGDVLGSATVVQHDVLYRNGVSCDRDEDFD